MYILELGIPRKVELLGQCSDKECNYNNKNNISSFLAKILAKNTVHTISSSVLLSILLKEETDFIEPQLL